MDVTARRASGDTETMSPREEIADALDEYTSAHVNWMVVVDSTMPALRGMIGGKLEAAKARLNALLDKHLGPIS